MKIYFPITKFIMYMYTESLVL